VRNKLNEKNLSVDSLGDLEVDNQQAMKPKEFRYEEKNMTKQNPNTDTLIDLPVAEEQAEEAKGGLQKIGPGTVILSQTNTYQGSAQSDSIIVGSATPHVKVFDGTR
jgi:autotransporter-associated beta strand protein